MLVWKRLKRTCCGWSGESCLEGHRVGQERFPPHPLGCTEVLVRLPIRLGIVHHLFGPLVVHGFSPFLWIARVGF